MVNDSARATVIRGLRAALAAHNEGRLFEIRAGWDEAASVEQGDPDPDLSIALRLWEEWADSAQHGWLYYEGMTADDWPRCAVSVLQSLEQHRMITDPELVERFAPRPPQPSSLRRLIARARAHFEGTKS